MKTPLRMPWPLTGAVMVFYLALGMHQESPGMLPILVLAYLATYVVPARIPQKSWAPWVLRIMAYGWITSTITRDDGSTALMFSQSTIIAFGVIWAIETVIQVWRERPAGNPPGSALIVITALGMIPVSVTPDDAYLKWTVPAYLLLITLSLRALNPLGTSIETIPQQEDADLYRTTARRAMLGRIAAFGAVALVGYGGYQLMSNNHDSLMSLGNNWTPHRRQPDGTGLSTAPSLGDMFDGEGSPTRVLRIAGRLTDPHLRGLAFDTYHNGTWLPVFDDGKSTDANATELQSGRRGERTRVHVFTDNLRLLVAPIDTVGVAPVDDIQIERITNRPESLLTDAQSPYAYDLILPGSSNKNPGPFAPPPSQEEIQRCLVVPKEIEPGVRSIAVQITNTGSEGKSTFANLGDATSIASFPPEKRIDAVTNYLISHYSYSLSFHPTPGEKISSFLLRGQAAHCEYFAASATILLRMLGVPTRYVTGYYAHEGAPDGSTMVRQRDSHAWAESWIDGKGWVTVDATPGGGRPDKLFPDTAVTWRIGEWIADRLQDARDYLSHFTPVQLSAGIGLIGGVFFLLQWAVKRRKVQAGSVEVRKFDIDAELLALSGRFESLLLRAGIPCPPSRTWEEHIDAERPASLDRTQLERFMTGYNWLRFGRIDDDALRAEIREALDALEKGMETNDRQTAAARNGVR